MSAIKKILDRIVILGSVVRGDDYVSGGHERQEDSADRYRGIYDRYGRGRAGGGQGNLNVLKLVRDLHEMPLTSSSKHAVSLSRFVATVSVSMLPGLATAQSPINIEQLLAKPATWQLSSSVDYQVGGAAFNPTQQGSWSTGVRYGLTPRIEFNAGIQGWELTQARGGAVFREREQSFSIGTNCLLKVESSLPAVLLEARAMLVSSGSSERQSLPSGQIALTTYKSIDPVVVSFTAAMTMRRSYELDDAQVRPGMSWRIEPGINFAVNSRVTLFGNATFSRRNAVYADGLRVAMPSERIGMRGGIALALSGGNSVFVSGELANDRSGGLSLQWLYEF